jgi:pimeloyl-ACP methyl ester carboxylesterase
MNVVLLHAFPLDERMWEPQREALAGHEAFAPNLYELGGNSVDGWAERILGDVDGDFVAVGASMGGYVALALARQAPRRVAGLVLAGARPQEDSPERRAGRADTIRLIQDEGAGGLWANQRSKLLADDASDQVVASAREMALARNQAELVSAIEAIRDRPDSSDTLRALDAPVLFALGAGDIFFPVEEAETVAADMGGRLVVFERSRHLPNLEQPVEFNELLLEFLGDRDALLGQ